MPNTASEAFPVEGDDSPLRAAARRNHLGRPAGEPARGAFRDGGEQRVLELIRQAADISSLSDELQRDAMTWAESYHLSADRANILRCLDLRATDRVLEIGSGCGAIARYLGETCTLVDGIEPDEQRAEVAMERVRDLPGVQIHVAGIDEVPDVPFYDVAVVVGVLEYVGLGSADPRPYTDFLQKIRSRLAPGGVLLLAIENLFGVKYLCGSPEDHTGQPYDGLTGYRRGGTARTFSRTQLAELFEAAGLAPTFLHVFPDYKMTRAVLSDGVFSSPYQSLAREIPQFPSPDRVPGSVRVASEEDVWGSLVDGGEADGFANSFLVMGATEAAESRWPADRLAAFYSLNRAAGFRTETLVEERDPPRFVRRRLSDAAPPAGRLVHEAATSEFIGGPRLDHVLERLTWDEMSTALAQWRQVVLANPGLVDLIPRNFRIGPDGALVSFDQEWQDDSYGPDDVLARGVFSLLGRVGSRVSEELPELSGASLRAVAGVLGAVAGLEPAGSWIDAAIDREADLQATVAAGTTGGEHWLRVRESVRADYFRMLPHPPPPPPPPPPRRPLPVRAVRRVARAFRVLVRGH